MNKVFCVIGILMVLSLSARAFAEDCTALKDPERTTCEIKQINQQRQKTLADALEKEVSKQKALVSGEAVDPNSKWQQSNQATQASQSSQDSNQDTTQQDADKAAQKAKDDKAKASGGWYFGY